MNRASNDSTLSSLGDTYQDCIALKDCFEINDEDILQIEENGDISVVSKNNSFQKEVKHHLGTSYITDRNIDIWKTLANWYVEYKRIKDFETLIFYTTSGIKLDSSWYNWNNLTSSEKLDRLNSIGKNKKTREKGFRKQYDRIFSAYNENKLLAILDKFSICHANINIVGIAKEFSKYIGHIPIENRDGYIGALIGQIKIKTKNPPHKCEITRQEFERILQIITPGFSTPGQCPLPTEYINEEVTKDKEKELRDKKFIEAICEIKHEVMISRAILDYWKANMTILKYFRDNPLYVRDLSGYEKSLEERLRLIKDTVNRRANGESQETCIGLSKDFYNSVMSWDARDFGSIIRNRDFFQRGVIHSIIDDGKQDWKVWGQDNEF